jgi:hypothetical protein
MRSGSSFPESISKNGCLVADAVHWYSSGTSKLIDRGSERWSPSLDFL